MEYAIPPIEALVNGNMQSRKKQHLEPKMPKSVRLVVEID
jgi:hypothetical protein